MTEPTVPLFLAHCVYSLTTLYMMGIVLRWLGPWIGIDLSLGRLRWVCRLTDPAVNRMRRLLPPMGPFDVGPVATLLVLWVGRTLVIRMLANIVA